MQISEMQENLLMFMVFIIIYWGVVVGKKSGLKYMLYDSIDGFTTSLGIAFGSVLAYSEIVNIMDGKEVSIAFLAISALVFLYSAVKTYQISAQQTYTTKDAIGLFLGKTVFAMVTLGLVLVIAALVGEKRANR